MVRNVVGSAVAVGRGAHDPDWMAGVLKSRDRRLAGATAPAHGLTLPRVLYEAVEVGADSSAAPPPKPPPSKMTV
jgi:tRNA pseudouridine38-40 synthase